MIKLYNTISKKKEVFKPIKKGEVTIYTCGPTAYDYPHIGNLRSYVFADILKRVFLYSNYKVKHIINITDVDDKTILNSQKENKKLKEFTEFYTEEFKSNLKTLNIIEPEKYTKATEYTQEMINIIENLLKKKIAYKSNDNSIYFDIKKFKKYGKLSKIDFKNQKINAQGRIKNDEYEKNNICDFALWKAYDKKDGNVFWESPFGKGRPGWHVECSAMAINNLGEQIDIHTGGVDNIFPHHENEIAQSEAYTGKKFVNYWLHNEWVLVNNEKMSKSKNNFYTLKDLTKEEIDGVAYRFWLLMANYGSRVNFVYEAFLGSKVALKRLYLQYLDLGEKIGKIDKNYQKRFKNIIQNDLNTPLALSLLWELFKDTNILNENKKATILDFDKVLGLDFANLKKEIIPSEILKLKEERGLAKKNKDYKKSDELREKINSLGYEVKDAKDDQIISKI